MANLIIYRLRELIFSFLFYSNVSYLEAGINSNPNESTDTIKKRLFLMALLIIGEQAELFYGKGSGGTQLKMDNEVPFCSVIK